MTGRMNEEVTTTRSDVIVALQDHGYTGRVNVKKTQLEEWLAEIDALPTIKERQTKAEQLSQENPKRDAGQPRGRGDGGMTWNECIVELRRLGWQGPTSYTVPRLREMIETLRAGGTVEVATRGRPRRGTTEDGGSGSAQPAAGESSGTAAA